MPPPSSAYPIQSRLADLDVSSFRWDQTQLMELSGVSMHVRPFTSAQAPHAAVQALARHTDLFQRVLTVKNKVMLSGLLGDWHWVAEINTTSHGSAGYVSAMYLDPVQSRLQRQVSAPDLGWLPPHAQRRFSQHMDADAGRISQYVYSVDQSPAALTSYLRQQLRNGGWKNLPDPAAIPGTLVWQRKRARLTLITVSSAQGSSLFVQHIE